MSLLDRFIIPVKNLVRYSRLFRNLATRLMVNLEFPAVIGADPTNRCNLNCSFCGTQKMETPKGAMSLDLFQRLVQECRDHPRLWMLILHNFGEPLMNKDLARMVALAKENNIARSVQFATNGTLLDENSARALIQAGLDGIVFSVDAGSREEYAALKGRDLLDRVMENAKMLMGLRKHLNSANPHVSAKMVRRKGAGESEKRFLAVWKPMVDEALLTPFSNWGDTVENLGGTPLPSKRYACHFLWYYPAVNWDGKVYFCCAACDEDAVIGDLKTSSLAEVWKGKRLREVRLAHLNGEFDKIKTCAKCTYWAESGSSLDSFLAKKMNVQ